MRHLPVSGSFKYFTENIIQRVIKSGHVLKEKSEIFPIIFLLSRSYFKMHTVFQKEKLFYMLQNEQFKIKNFH